MSNYQVVNEENLLYCIYGRTIHHAWGARFYGLGYCAPLSCRGISTRLGLRVTCQHKDCRTRKLALQSALASRLLQAIMGENIATVFAKLLARHAKPDITHIDRLFLHEYIFGCHTHSRTIGQSGLYRWGLNCQRHCMSNA